MSKPNGAVPVQDERSVAQLVSDLTEQTTRLIKTEARLAAREMAVKVRRGARGAGAFSAAGLLGAYAGAALVACVVLALATAMAGWLAALITGGALLVLAGFAVLAGRAQLRKALPPLPDDTIERVREDIAVVTEHKERA
jgi:predicted phage tail protein